MRNTQRIHKIAENNSMYVRKAIESYYIIVLFDSMCVNALASPIIIVITGVMQIYGHYHGYTTH